MEYLLPSSYFSSLKCPWLCGGSLLDSIYIWVLFLYPSHQSLLVGAFNPFTFKVMIDMYDPITIFLSVLGLLFVGFFLLLCCLPRELPLVFVVKLVCWC